MEEIIIEEIRTLKDKDIRVFTIIYNFRGKQYLYSHSGFSRNIDLMHDQFIVWGYIEQLYLTISLTKSLAIENRANLIYDNRLIEVKIYPIINKIFIPQLSFCNICVGCERYYSNYKRYNDYCSKCSCDWYNDAIQNISNIVKEKIILKHDLRVKNELSMCT